MEYVLLSHSRIFSEGGRVKISAEIFVYSSLHPYVNRKGIKVGKCKQSCARSHLFAHSFDFLKLRESDGIVACIFDFFKVYLARKHLSGGVCQILISEAGVRIKKLLGRRIYRLGRWEGIAYSAFAAGRGIEGRGVLFSVKRLVMFAIHL